MNRSFEKLRRLINENFVCNPNEAHLTLTYRGLMKDRDQVSEDFKKFWKRLKYQYPALEYIAVYELTGRYSWHVHVLVKNTGAESWSIKNTLYRKCGDMAIRKCRISGTMTMWEPILPVL